MCYNLSYVENRARKLEKRYGESLPAENPKLVKSAPTYYFVSGYSHPELTILYNLGFEIMKWGLIPAGATDEKIADLTLNARSEDVFETRSFRLAIHQQRCILPVTGFFEWRHINGKKIPYHIQIPEEDVFSLGCIYDRHQDKVTGKMVKTFSILTTDAVGIMKEVHNSKLRMPFILPPDYESAWIDPTITKEDIKSLMQPYYGDLKATSISTEANYSKNDRNKYDILNEVRYSDIPPL